MKRASRAFPCAYPLAAAFLWANTLLTATQSPDSVLAAGSKWDFRTANAISSLALVYLVGSANDLSATRFGQLNFLSALRHGQKRFLSARQNDEGQFAALMQPGSESFMPMDQIGFAHRAGVSRYGIRVSARVEQISLIHSADLYQSGNGPHSAATQHGANQRHRESV